MTATKRPILFLSPICSLKRKKIVLKDCKAFFKGTAKSRCFRGLVLPETECFKSIHSSRWTSLHWRVKLGACKKFLLHLHCPQFCIIPLNSHDVFGQFTIIQLPGNT